MPDLDQAVRWFGENWGAHINRLCRSALTPVGDACIHCEQPIAMGDQGILMWGGDDQTRVPVHVDCLVMMVGGKP